MSKPTYEELEQLLNDSLKKNQRLLQEREVLLEEVKGYRDDIATATNVIMALVKKLKIDPASPPKDIKAHVMKQLMAMAQKFAMSKIGLGGYSDDDEGDLFDEKLFAPLFPIIAKYNPYGNQIKG